MPRPKSPPLTADIDEETPLLARDAEEQEPEGEFRLGQIVILCACRVLDPISFFCIIPFVNFMVEDTGVREENVGFYTGLIESLFSLTQMAMMISWGRAADRFGRRPITLVCLAGLTVSSAAFGFTRTIWQMALTRCVAGLFAGTVVSIRAMVYENATPSTQARAFSIFAFAGNIGIFAGPLIGGLAKPAEQYPGLFGQVPFFTDHPYALPTLVVGGLGVISTTVAFFSIEETLGRNKPRGSEGEVPKPPMSTLEILRAPNVLYVLVLFCWIALLAFGFTAVAPLFLFTSPPLGGLGFPPRLISAFLAGCGASQAAWLLLGFPPLHARLGTGGVLRACIFALPLFYAAHPLLALLRRSGAEAAFWGLAGPALVLGSGVAMQFTAVQLAINDVAPSAEVLGTVNGLALTAQSATRAFSPAVFTSVYAWGVGRGVLGGYFGWVVLIVGAVGLGGYLMWFPKELEGKGAKKSGGDEEGGGRNAGENGRAEYGGNGRVEGEGNERVGAENEEAYS
ncbi:MFS general substrate transporter [Trichodelitschia bisporula]|uniref:MFS general substrate transporter n=1 Tax=Trichodelitschia bisporula TaxID=703511 RepID=A0A6G1HU33_9PEZI|nr:MFS general substrate transporter [Trichodelitschia bisporula]